MFYSGKVTGKTDGKPLAGIPVSDGRNIVLTDEKGSYSLPGWERSHVVNVGVLTKDHDDWFAYTGGAAGTYDFCITPVETSPDFCFLHTSDTEIQGRKVIDWVSFARQQVEENSPAFFVHTGDICRRDGLSRHYLAMNVNTVGCPVRYVIGNHDFTDGDYGEQYFEQLYGPTWWSFDYGDIHFAVLSIHDGEKATGYQREDQWIWLKNDLARMDKSKRLIVLEHGPCPGKTSFCPTIGDITVDLRAEGLLAWMFGHYHHHSVHEYDGIFSICTACPDCGGVDSSVAGFRKISISGHTLTSKMLYNRREVSEADNCVWRTKLSGNIEFSAPLLLDGDVIVCTSDDGYPKECGVYRLDGKTGDIRWFFRTKNSAKGDPAYKDGRVYAQDCAGQLYCIDAESGTLLWKVGFSPCLAEYTRTGTMIVGDLVITGDPATVYAYNAKSGELVWKCLTADASDTPARFVYDEKRKHLIVSAQWRMLAALDIETGEIVWKTPDQPVWYRTATPLVTDDMIYTSGLESLAAVDPVSGAVVRKNKLGFCVDVSGAPVPDGDTLYYPTGESGVIAVDAATLEIKRKYPTGNAALFTPPYLHGDVQIVEGSPIIIGDTLIFAASDGKVWFYDKNTAQLQKTVSIGAPSLVSPVLTDKHMIIADFSGCVAKFEL